MTMAQFERVVDEVVDSLPDWVLDRIDNLSVVVAEHPTREQDPDGAGLLGLYEGVSLLERGNDYFGAMPDTITVFRRSHLALGLTDDELRDEIRRTVLHELGHHLGIDDHRLDEIGWADLSPGTARSPPRKFLMRPFRPPEEDRMDELLAMIESKFGLPADQARSVVETVATSSATSSPPGWATSSRDSSTGPSTSVASPAREGAVSSTRPRTCSAWAEATNPRRVTSSP